MAKSCSYSLKNKPRLLNDEIITQWENCYYDNYPNDWLSWLFANEYSTIKEHTSMKTKQYKFKLFNRIWNIKYIVACIYMSTSLLPLGLLICMPKMSGIGMFISALVILIYILTLGKVDKYIIRKHKGE